MGQITAALHRKAEAGRCLLTPVLNRGGGRQTIEAIVNFNGIEVSDIPAQVFRRLEALGVKTAAPMFIVPSRSADPQLWGCVLSAHDIEDSRPQAEPVGSPPEAKPGDDPPHLVGPLDGRSAATGWHVEKKLPQVPVVSRQARPSGRTQAPKLRGTVNWPVPPESGGEGKFGKFAGHALPSCTCTPRGHGESQPR